MWPDSDGAGLELMLFWGKYGIYSLFKVTLDRSKKLEILMLRCNIIKYTLSVCHYSVFFMFHEGVRQLPNFHSFRLFGINNQLLHVQ